MPPIDLSRRHYDAMVGPHDVQHPVDVAVAALPEVRDIDARARSQALRMARAEVRAANAAWVHYDDLRLLQRSIRQERFFDAGFEHGLLAGRTEAQRHAGRGGPDGVAAHATASDALAAILRKAVLRAPLPRHAQVAVVLELARALVLDPP
jgi:hypothetical protein